MILPDISSFSHADADPRHAPLILLHSYATFAMQIITDADDIFFDAASYASLCQMMILLPLIIDIDYFRHYFH